MERKLTKEAIERARPKDKPYELAFRYKTVLRVQPTGTKTLWCQYARGKRKRIGDANVILIQRAEHMARGILNEVSDFGRPLKGGLKKSTVGGFVDEVYAPWLKANRRRADKTLSDVRRCFKSMWDSKLTEIDHGTLDEYVETRFGEGVSTATIRRDLNNLQGACRLAVSRGYLREHPFKGWMKPDVEDSGITRYLEADEEERLRKALQDRDDCARTERQSANRWRQARGYDALPEIGTYSDHLTPMVFVSLNTGLRYGELAALQWSAVNFSSRVLTVTAATAKGKKTRHIPMNDECAGILKQWKQQGDGKGLVFPNGEDEPIGTVKTAWLALLKDAEIENFRWHDLRHSFASKLVQRGVSLAIVRDLLGHGDFKLTLRYAHLDEKQKSEAVKALVGPA